MFTFKKKGRVVFLKKVEKREKKLICHYASFPVKWQVKMPRIIVQQGKYIQNNLGTDFKGLGSGNFSN